MNILLIIVAVIFLVFLGAGWHKGLIRSVFSCGAAILAIIVTINCAHFVGKALIEYTPIETTIQKQIGNTIIVDPDKEENLVRTDQTEAIQELKLPEGVKKGLIENNNKEIYTALNATGFYEYVTNYLTDIVVNGIAFIITFLLSLIIIRLLLRFLDFLTELPILKGLNRIGGLAFGLVEGLVVVWLIFILITVFSATSVGQMMVGFTNDSLVLSILYNNNLLLEFITSMSKLLF